MGTDELIVKLNSIGYKTHLGYDSIRKVINVRKIMPNSSSSKVVAILSIENMFEASFRWKAYSDLANEEKKELYDLLKEYIETPIEKR